MLTDRKPQIFAAYIGRRVRYVGAAPCSKCGKTIEAEPVRWHCMAAVNAFVLFHTKAVCGECEKC